MSVGLHRELQYSIWLTTIVVNNVSIGCRALVLNVFSNHPDIRCPVAVVFLMCMSNLASEDTSTPRSQIRFFCLITVRAGVWYVGLFLFYHILSAQIYHYCSACCFHLPSHTNVAITAVGYLSHEWHLSLAKALCHPRKILSLLS